MDAAPGALPLAGTRFGLNAFALVLVPVPVVEL